MGYLHGLCPCRLCTVDCACLIECLQLHAAAVHCWALERLLPLTASKHKSLIYIFNFVFGAMAPSGPGPPNSCVF
jgi:hypothetical protein